jgi:hypothetical protein
MCQRAVANNASVFDVVESILDEGREFKRGIV